MTNTESLANKRVGCQPWQERLSAQITKSQTTASPTEFCNTYRGFHRRGKAQVPPINRLFIPACTVLKVGSVCVYRGETCCLSPPLLSSHVRLSELQKLQYPTVRSDTSPQRSPQEKRKLKTQAVQRSMRKSVYAQALNSCQL